MLAEFWRDRRIDKERRIADAELRPEQCFAGRADWSDAKRSKHRISKLLQFITKWIDRRLQRSLPVLPTTLASALQVKRTRLRPRLASIHRARNPRSGHCRFLVSARTAPGHRKLRRYAVISLPHRA